ncbi:hypothetical protein PI125_g13418 [Phytophthora idaei]|nr:hypothetical protein PI125_g13418 [Phytophthora idaei]KAG3165365.1 hypothetical protein PI126_g4679 [Phytophthora idaei]
MTASQTGITNVGTLESLGVTNGISCGSLSCSTGTISGYTLSSGAGGITGKLNTAGQTIITSVGTLTGLWVGGAPTAHTMIAGNTIGTTTTNVWYNLVVGQNSDTVGAGSGISFTNDSAYGTNLSAMTPSCSIVATRTGGSYAYSNLCFYTRSLDSATSPMAERMTIAQAGNVGIDNPSPQMLLDLGQQTVDRKISIYNTGVSTSDFYGLGANGAALRFYSAGSHEWYIASKLSSTLGTKSMILNTSGRLMVGGNLAPEAFIHSGGEIFANNMFHSKNNVDGQAKYRFNWSQANYPGLGTDAIAGAVRLGICDGSYNWVSYVPVRGGAYTNASDRRIKRNIIDIPYGLAEVMRMRPRRFIMIEGNTDHVGFIAQEMAEVIPEVKKPLMTY